MYLGKTVWNSYNRDLAAEVVLDFARLDRIGGVLGDNLVEV
jgi:hypothetical protein